jgi:regulatory protein
MSDAYQHGVRLLSRRPLSRREVAERLLAAGHEADDVEAAVVKLTAGKAIDDDALARHWIGSQASARGRGRLRALQELAARGVDEAVAAAAWSDAVADGSIEDDELLARAVRRRLGPPQGAHKGTRLARVYNALLSEGFESAEVERALAPYGFQRTDP